MNSKPKLIKDILTPKQPPKRSKNSPIKSSPRVLQHIYANLRAIPHILSQDHSTNRNSIHKTKKEQLSIHSNSSTKSNQSFSNYSENSKILSEYLNSESYSALTKAEPAQRKRIPSSYRSSMQIDNLYAQENIKINKNPNFRASKSPVEKAYSAENKLIMIEFNPVRFVESMETEIDVDFVPIIPVNPPQSVLRSIIQVVATMPTEKDLEASNE
ncbi:unnamed protein product [Blepharisma stoltei]|uniref:Uncharacterized protein n=1 Tax=Blepharisma stoltei TaxID=1481888 RepID=A0AAU9JPI2_9CILI|nr:unnamed protein product [Blepharisma stoltei]